MNASTRGYLAGMIDGEGSISIVRARRDQSKRPTRSTVYHELTIHVFNNDCRIMLWLLDNVGGIVNRREPRKIQHAPSYTWTVTNKVACELLKSIFSLLVSKIQQARLAIEFFESKQTRKTFDRGCLTSEELSKRDNFFERIKELNLKGPHGSRSKLGELREPETLSRRQSAAKPSRDSEGSETTGERYTALNNQD